MDLKPDRDGRDRVNDFFCFDIAWKLVVTRLARDSDAVLVDLRGFSRGSAGVVFELTTLVDLVPLNRVVLTVDGTTDRAFLDATIRQARAQAGAGSPNRDAEGVQPAVVVLGGGGLGELPRVLSALARAAA
jgi:hypothetical protein